MARTRSVGSGHRRYSVARLIPLRAETAVRQSGEALLYQQFPGRDECRLATAHGPGVRGGESGP